MFDALNAIKAIEAIKAHTVSAYIIRNASNNFSEVDFCEVVVAFISATVAVAAVAVADAKWAIGQSIA